MFLKSLEIRGFKSFADKTELQFKQGVTAVVGPNGSGKSNISDSVKWVLGEQSVKSLRGSKMQDVIFAGTQFRKPVGLAQVSLILDNNDEKLNIDYSQVKITRRLYRSGESEYYINNTKCRLKDIQELFMDTGIGKEGYSLIGQGKIDAILSGQADDRRNLLEEAAGIVKFKSRKIEAEKRLNNTEQNLVRINDILGTYEERIEPLRIDKEKAELFLELSDELKIKEINLIINSVNKLQSKFNEIKNKIDEKNCKLKELENLKVVNKEKLEKCTEELEKFEMNSSKDKQRYYSCKSENEKVISEIKFSNERIVNLDEYIKKDSKEIEELDNKIKELIDKNNNTSEEYNKINQIYNEVVNKIKEYDDKINNNNMSISEDDMKLNEIKKVQNDITNNISESKNKLIIFDKESSQLKSKLLEVTERINNYSNSLKINNNTCIALNEEIEKSKIKINDYKIKIGENDKLIQVKRSELTKKEKKIRKLNNQISEADANYKILFNLNEQYEGYNKAVQRLMKDIKDKRVNCNDQSCFILGEIINVDRKYETAYEIALGGSISNIITENESIAKRLINHLKERRLGRATFLPLNIVRGRKLNLSSEIKNLKGFIGIASDLLSYNKKFQNAIEFVLGRTIIVDNMDNALNIAKKSNNSYKIVTLSGEVLNPGGSMTGGSIYHKNSSIIGRKREINDLKEKKEILSKEVENSMSSFKNLSKEIEVIDEENLNLKDAVHSENVELARLQTRFSNIKEEGTKINNSIKEESFRKIDVEKHIEVIKDKWDKLNKAIVDMEISENEYIEQIGKMEFKLKEKYESINKLSEKLTDFKIKKAQNEEIITNKLSEIERYKSEIKENQNKLKKLNDEKVDSIEQKKKCIKTIEENKEKSKETLDLISQLEEKFNQSEFERAKIKEKLKEYRGKIENIALEISNYEKELHKIELNYAKIESDREVLVNKLNEDLNLTLAEAQDYRIENINPSTMAQETEELKKRIKDMGIINVAAIEEYKELKEKYTFMNGQREDLLNAKDELMSVIEEMTEKMRTIFKENFIKLRKNFNETFKELFKGGSADLILSDGDELSAKIDINVQPPGKKLQNINLMSGGEKVLSAIALLFAILKMKPTPFCILDEIEAALDDANVYRYAEFLKKFSEKIQFIVITHRKGTMSVSDVLYGITMEEKGISKIVSVDMQKTSE